MNSKAKGLEHINNKEIIEKASLTRISINQLPKQLPEFKNSETTKDIAIAQWLEKWIKTERPMYTVKPDSARKQS